MMRGKFNRNPWVLFILLMAGIVIGGVIGDILSNYIEFFDYNYPIGIREPLNIDLNVLAFTFGLIFNINAGSILGIIFAVISYLRT